MRKCLYLVFASIFLAGSFAFAAGSDDILGVWNTEKKDARIAIYRCGAKYCGKIAWLKKSTYSADSKDGVPGTPILDSNNPNPESRKKPLIGVHILADFVYLGDNVWEKGTIYDSDNGKLYSGKIILISPDQLNVKGFIGISLIGGSTTWSRFKASTD